MSYQSSLRLLTLCLASLVRAGAADRPSEAIQDNSFLVEEAYNQEAGVVQHVFNLFGSVNRLPGADDREWVASFTEEWPVLSQAHQFSYTVPYVFSDSGGAKHDGFGDVLLHYRFQLSTETATRPAIAPRVSVILPTGDEDRGLGSGSVGFQTNTALSKVLNDRWTVHANAGATVLPDVQSHDLTGFNLGVSAIYALSPSLNLLVECTANWDEEVDDAGHRDRSVSVLLSPGFRYGINLPGDAQLVLGVAAPIGLTRDAPDYGIFFYASFEHFFSREKPAVK